MMVNGHLVAPGMGLKLAVQSGRSRDGQLSFSKPVVSLPPEWEIDRKRLSLSGKLGEGEFGVVYRGEWTCTPVAAKVLKIANITLGDLRTEVSVLRRVHHPNVVQFLGACVEKVWGVYGACPACTTHCTHTHIHHMHHIHIHHIHMHTNTTYTTYTPYTHHHLHIHHTGPIYSSDRAHVWWLAAGCP